MADKQTVIISLGGSLVAPEDIDVKFLKSFKKALQPHIKKYQFLIVVGGGKPARQYQKAMADLGANNQEKDWVGIRLSRANAKVVWQAFASQASREIITDPTKKISSNKPILLGAGYKPGFSTDYVSVLAAKTWGVKTIINLSNVDYVYDKNPNKFKGAKPFKEIRWKDFRKIVGNKWSPGLNMPFDPRASQLAERMKLKVVMIGGRNLKSFENFLGEKPFKGTTIQ